MLEIGLKFILRKKSCGERSVNNVSCHVVEVKCSSYITVLFR
jgi:hypothetical protein